MPPHPIKPDGSPQNIGVINPFALAEEVSGRHIDWDTVPNVPELLEELLQTPYHELFDPVHEGPLYTGLRLNRSLELERVHSPLLDVEVDTEQTDLDLPFNGEHIQVLRDLGPRFDTDDVGSIPVLASETTSGGRMVLTLRLPEKDRLQRLHAVFGPALVRTIAYDPDEDGAADKDWNPPNGTWGTTGDFFNETAEFFDPVQGAVANCYYIAALGAVAWATPQRISHVTRATGTGQGSFVDRVSFYKADSGGQLDQHVEVTEAVPLNSSGNFIYCRSSEADETWPAIYEKAFAKLVTGTSGDQPDITATAWGDPVGATARLNGGHRSYWNTAGRTGSQLWDIVRSHSVSRRTIRPMTASTYSTGAASEKKIVYDDTNIVASHAYTVLGWDYRDGKRYILLRNPWGRTEPTVGVLAGTTYAYDISWWRPIAMAPNDGTFGIEADTFQTYFRSIGVAA